MRELGQNRSIRVSPHWGSDGGAIGVSHSLSQHGTYFFRRPRGMHCLAPHNRLSQKYWDSRSIFGVSAVGNLPTKSPVRGQKHFQPALQEFQRFIVSLLVGSMSLGGIIREGRCCNRRNFPRTRLSGTRLSWPKLAKATSELVPTLHLWEEKLAASFGSCNSPRLLDVVQK